jgi:hypothetical protein
LSQRSRFPTRRIALCSRDWIANKKGQPVATIERTPQRLVLRLGSTTVTLDKEAGAATMERRLLFWSRKPVERPLSDFARVTIDTNVDRASGVELCSPMLVMHDGSAWALKPTGRQDATQVAAVIRDFLRLSD